MTTFYNFTIKMETTWAKKVLKTICKLEMPMTLLCVFDLFILR